MKSHRYDEALIVVIVLAIVSILAVIAVNSPHNSHGNTTNDSAVAATKQKATKTIVNRIIRKGFFK